MRDRQPNNRPVPDDCPPNPLVQAIHETALQKNRVQQIAAEYIEAWRGYRQGIDEILLSTFLPASDDPLRLPVLHELIPTDLEQRRRRGENVLLENYLQDFPELGSAQDLPVELISAEYRIRRLQGAPLRIESYRLRFPNQFDALVGLVGGMKGKQSPVPGNGLPSRSEPTPGPPSQGNSSPSPVPIWATMSPADPAQVTISRKVMPVGEGYQLHECIGRGMFGEVWRAEAPGGVEVAVKIIHRTAGDQLTQVELRALELMKQLRHPFLLQVQAYWLSGDQLHIVMDLAERTLMERLEECRRGGLPGIPAEELLTYMQEAAEALDFLHSEKVLHRDVKPANILLAKGHARLADFGLARAFMKTGFDIRATTIGTPLYMGPEVWEQEVGPESDQYSLAATYVELRLGRPLFDVESQDEVKESHLTAAPELKGFSPAEKKVIEKALAKKRRDRYASCTQFAQALEEAIKGPSQRPKSSLTGRQAVTLLLCGAVACAAVGIAWRQGWLQPHQGKEMIATKSEQPPPVGAVKVGEGAVAKQKGLAKEDDKPSSAQPNLKPDPKKLVVVQRIDPDGAFTLALASAEESLRNGSEPNVAEAIAQIEIALKERENPGLKLAINDINRLSVLLLWKAMQARESLIGKQEIVQAGLTAFVMEQDDAPFKIAFLDALFEWSASSDDSVKQLSETLPTIDRLAANQELWKLVEARVRVARLSKSIQGPAEPKWIELAGELRPLIPDHESLAASSRPNNSPFRESLLLLDAVFLEASVSLKSSPDQEIKAAFKRLNDWIGKQPMPPTQCGENAPVSPMLDATYDYLSFVQDLSLGNWKGLRPAGYERSGRLLIQSLTQTGLSPQMCAPFRRRSAGDLLLRKAQEIAPLSDADFHPQLSQKTLGIAVEALEAALIWYGAENAEEADEAKAWLVLALAFGDGTPMVWRRIRDLSDSISSEDHAKKWTTANIWGQLLLASARAHHDNRADEKSRSLTIQYYGEFTDVTMSLSEARVKFSDDDWCEKVWKPCQDYLGTLDLGAMIPKELRASYASIFGMMATILERDREHVISRKRFQEAEHPDLPSKSRQEYFHLAGKLDENQLRRARWLVGEGRAIRDSSNDGCRSEIEQLQSIATEAMLADPDYHGCYEIEANLNLTRSRFESTLANRMKLLNAAGNSYTRAVELVSKVPYPQEAECFKPQYLVLFSQIHLERAFYTSRISERIKHLRAAESWARKATEVDERVRPEESYIAWGNALEDMACHVGCLFYFGKSEEKFQEAVDLARTNRAKAIARFNLGRVQYRHALKGRPTIDQFKTLRDAAVSNLSMALTDQLDDNRKFSSLQTESFLAQIDLTLYKSEAAPLRRQHLLYAVERFDRIAKEAKTLHPTGWVMYRRDAAESARLLASDYYSKDPKDLKLGPKYHEQAHAWAQEVYDAKDIRVSPDDRAVVAKILINTDSFACEKELANNLDESFARKEQILVPILNRFQNEGEASGIGARIWLLEFASTLVCESAENLATRQKWLDQAEEMAKGFQGDELNTGRKYQVEFAGFKAIIKAQFGRLQISSGKKQPDPVLMKKGFGEVRAAADLVFDALKQAKELQASLQEVAVDCNLSSEQKGEHGTLPAYDAVMATLLHHRDQLHGMMGLLKRRDNETMTNAEKRHYLQQAQDALQQAQEALSAVGPQHVEKEKLMYGEQIKEIGDWQRSIGK